MIAHISAAAAVSLLIAMTVAAGADTLGAHRWKDRVVVLIAPNASDSQLREQRAILRAAAAGLKERDIVILEALDDGPEATALRRQFAAGQTAFRAVLVGKDGGAKLASDRPLSAQRLFGEIDAMPMRQQEMRGR